MNLNPVDLLWIVAALAVGVFSKYARDYVVLYLKERREDYVWRFVWRAVNAAEQYLYEGDDKYDWVFSLVKQRFPNLDVEEIRSYIEFAVRELNRLEEEVNE